MSTVAHIPSCRRNFEGMSGKDGEDPSVPTAEPVTVLDLPPCYLDRDFYDTNWLGEIHRWWEERWR